MEDQLEVGVEGARHLGLLPCNHSRPDRPLTHIIQVRLHPVSGLVLQHFYADSGAISKNKSNSFQSNSIELPVYNSWQEPSWTKSDLVASLDIDLNGTFHKDFNVLDLTDESEFPNLTTSSSDLIFQTCMQPERKRREFTDRQNVSRESGPEEICGPVFRSHSYTPRQKKTQKRLYKGPYQPVESQTFLPRTYTKKKIRPKTTHSNLDDKTNCFTSLTAQSHLSDLSNEQDNVCQSVLDSAELLCSNSGPPQMKPLETCKKTSMGDTKTDKKLKQRQRKRRQKHYIDMRPTVFSECPNDETLSIESNSPKNDIWAYATISVILPIDTPSSS